ncbi:Bax inhibitor-1/YccA family protein [Pontibacillus salicampi]|uniref:Bax inhibitor-1/YccA family protein n=1 Tax=Pontibacillus salicampi TaxID=1449801 RepID=A0ABV6LQI9_9BACI
MRTGNPSLSDKTFDRYRGMASNEEMTIQGSVNKTFVLLLLVAATAIYSWNLFVTNPDLAMMVMIGGAIGGLVFALITAFAPKAAPVTAPIYAVLEGLFIGGISATYEAQFEGIVFQAVILTLGVLCSLLLAYKSGLIKVTQNFRLGVVAATGAIFVVYLVSFIGGFFGFEIPHLHEATPLGIAISVGIVIIAALNLVLDFDFIEKGAGAGVPKHMEWYAAFGLIVTLVWLYIEILRLLSKIYRR